MRKIFILFVSLLVAALPLRAQYVAGVSPMENSVDLSRIVIPKQHSSAATTCFFIGAGMMTGGFAIGGHVAGAENPSKALSITGEVLLVGGFAMTAGSLGAMFLRDIPSYRIAYCGRYASEHDTRAYTCGMNAAKVMGISGAAMFAASMGFYLAGYHMGTLETLNPLHKGFGYAGLATILTAAVTGVIVDSTYYNRAKRAYGSSIAMNVGPTASGGLGLEFTF